MTEFKAFEIENFNCQAVDPYYIFEHIDEFDIIKIALDFTYSMPPDYVIKLNDEEHPITYTNSSITRKTLSISSEYYEKHRDLIDKLIIEICKKTKTKKLSLLSTKLIDDAKINALSSNSNLQSVILGSRKDVFALDSDTYSALKNKAGKIKDIVTNAVAPELENNFDPIIFFNQFKKLVGNADYDTLSSTSMLTIPDNLNAKDLENLKYLNSYATVRIDFSNSTNFITIINRLKELNPDRNIIIKVENKNDFNETLFKHIKELTDLKNIKVDFSKSYDPTDLLTYIRYEKELISMITPALDLSPFEKYLYAYNIAKLFKDYKENKEDKSASRNLYKILDNDYIVCAGFSNLLGDLLDKLFIENNNYSVKVETAYDGLKSDIAVIPNEVINNKTGKKREILPRPGHHARREVHIVDPKYNIDGYYIADPTWDNELDHDSYTYALMTHDEFVGAKRYTYMNQRGVDELFFVHNIEEFYQKLNMLLDKNRDKSLNEFINELLNRIKKLDKNFFKMLAEKYQLSPKQKTLFSFEVQQELLFDIANHIVNKTNNLVNGQQFKQAITTIYNLIYDSSYVNIDSLVEETIKYNEEEYSKRFPTRYRIDKSENTSIELNEFNKFSTDEVPENKISL